MARPEESLLDHPLIRDTASACGRTPAQVLLRWGIQRGTAVIPKTSRPERLKERLRVHLQPWTGLLVDAIRMGQQGGWLKAGVDPESFVVLVVANTVGMVAVGEAASALVPGEPTLAAQEVELGRIARSALLGEGL
jgi:hypothetical protein